MIWQILSMLLWVCDPRGAHSSIISTYSVRKLWIHNLPGLLYHCPEVCLHLLERGSDKNKSYLKLIMAPSVIYINQSIIWTGQ